MTKTNNEKKYLHVFMPNSVSTEDDERYYIARPFFFNELQKHFNIKLYCKIDNKTCIDSIKQQPIDANIDIIDFFDETSFIHLLKQYQKYKKEIKKLPKNDFYFSFYPLKRSGVILAYLLHKYQLTIWVKSLSGLAFIPSESKVVNFFKRLTLPIKRLLYKALSNYIFTDNLIFYTSDIVFDKQNHLHQHEIISCSDFNRDKSLIRYDFSNEICFVGGEQPQKGLIYVLQALHLIPERKRPKLNIIGIEKIKRKKHQKLAKDLDIKIHGKVYERDAFYKKLAENDFLIMPSIAEKQGKVQLEAMSAGVVPVCADSGGTHQTMDNFYNGLLFKERDISELASQIQLLYKNPSLHKNMQSNGLKTIQNLSLERQCYKMASIITNRYLK
jgi:glycosyltransferase involved in cell wall biosynthesis